MGLNFTFGDGVTCKNHLERKKSSSEKEEEQQQRRVGEGLGAERARESGDEGC